MKTLIIITLSLSHIEKNIRVLCSL